MGQCGRIITHESHIAYSTSQLFVQNPIPKLDYLSFRHPLGNYNQPSHTNVCLAKTLISFPLKLLKTPQLLHLHPLVVVLQPQKKLCDRVNDALPSSLWTHLRVQVWDNAEKVGTWSRSLAHNTWKG